MEFQLISISKEQTALRLCHTTLLTSSYLVAATEIAATFPVTLHFGSVYSLAATTSLAQELSIVFVENVVCRCKS